jgi:hypothetical protein
MGGSEDESRVSAVGSDASSMLSPELAKRSSRKKKCNCKSIRMDPIRTGNDSSIRTRRTSEIQIEHQTKLSKLSQDETDLAREGLLRKCVRNSMRLHVALQKSTPSNARRRRCAFGSLKPAYGTPPAVQWPIDRVVTAPISTSDLEFF